MAELNMKKLRQAIMPYMGFVDDFHNKVVSSKNVKRNEDGSLTTVFSRGIKFGDKIYEVPAYDPETGENLSERQVSDNFLPMLESGELQKSFGDFGIPVSSYKTIMELYQQFKEMSKYNDIPDDAIKFDFLRK